jgi:hypothetical protein
MITTTKKSLERSKDEGEIVVKANIRPNSPEKRRVQSGIHIHGDETIERIEGRKGIRVNKVD